MEQPSAAEFPQHARLATFNEDMEIVHAFLHNTKGYELCTWNESENAFVPVTKNCEEILCEFFEIDRAALDQERRVLRGMLMDLLAREAADDMFEQLNLQVQEENDATPEAVEDMFEQLNLQVQEENDAAPEAVEDIFKQLDLLIEKEEDDD